MNINNNSLNNNFINIAIDIDKSIDFLKNFKNFTNSNNDLWNNNIYNKDLYFNITKNLLFLVQ